MARVIRNEYEPDLVSPPGDSLLETLEEIGMTQVELAERTGRPLKTINEIINGKAAITPETALQLERVLRVPARFWNSRERLYQEHLARQQEAERLTNAAEWLSSVPVNEMIKLKWIQKRETVVETARQVLDFFGVATPETYLRLCVGEQVAYRRSLAMQGRPAAVAAWLRRGELIALDIVCEPYDVVRFRGLLPHLRSLTLSTEPQVFVPNLQRLCAQCGVAVVFVPEISGANGTRLCGAARWLSPDKALIQLSLRYKDHGSMWFTFFHEAAHVMLHSKKTFFVDEKIGDGEGGVEEEANRFASDLLIPPAEYARFISQRVFTNSSFRRFASETGVAPGIVVGRLQHDGIIDYRAGHALKVRYEWKS